MSVGSTGFGLIDIVNKLFKEFDLFDLIGTQHIGWSAITSVDKLRIGHTGFSLIDIVNKLFEGFDLLDFIGTQHIGSSTILIGRYTECRESFLQPSV